MTWPSRRLPGGDSDGDRTAAATPFLPATSSSRRRQSKAPEVRMPAGKVAARLPSSSRRCSPGHGDSPVRTSMAAAAPQAAGSGVLGTGSGSLRGRSTRLGHGDGGCSGPSRRAGRQSTRDRTCVPHPCLPPLASTPGLRCTLRCRISRRGRNTVISLAWPIPGKAAWFGADLQAPWPDLRAPWLDRSTTGSSCGTGLRDLSSHGANACGARPQSDGRMTSVDPTCGWLAAAAGRGQGGHS